MKNVFRNIDIIYGRGSRSEGDQQLMHLIQVFNSGENYEGSFRNSFEQLPESEQDKFQTLLDGFHEDLGTSIRNGEDYEVEETL